MKAYEGVIGKIMIAEGTEGVKVNEVIAVLLEDGESAGDIGETPAAAPEAQKADAGAEAASTGGSDKPAPPAPAAPVKDGSRVFATPLARRIAADKGLNLATLKGSGPHGRIVKADVENASAAPATVAPATKAAAPVALRGIPA